MNNVSKAVIIAGGILIGVLIISICMYMLTSFRDIYGNSMKQFETQQVMSFNSFFVQFGSKIKGYDVYNIIGKINEINSDSKSEYFINFNNNNNSISKETFYYTENLLDNFQYSYEFDEEGAINKVNIVKLTD